MGPKNEMALKRTEGERGSDLGYKEGDHLEHQVHMMSHKKAKPKSPQGQLESVEKRLPYL